MLRRWLLAPVLRELRSIHLTLNEGFRAMTTEMEDLTAAETELADEVALAVKTMADAEAEIESLTSQLTNSSPSGIETIVGQIREQTAKLRAARMAAFPAPASAAPTPAPAVPVPAPAPVAPAAPAPSEADLNAPISAQMPEEPAPASEAPQG